MIDILVYEKDNLVVDSGTITKREGTMGIDLWDIEKDGETHVRGGEFKKYTVTSLPEDYADYKYYYNGFFQLNVLYYHNETEHRLEALEKENTMLYSTIDDILINIIPSIMGKESEGAS